MSSVQPLARLEDDEAVCEVVGDDDVHGAPHAALTRAGASGSAEESAPFGRGVADHEEGRAGNVGAVGDRREVREPAREEPALGERRVLDHGDRRRRAETRADQTFGHLRGDGAAHVDGDRRAGERQAGPVGQHVASRVLAGREDEARCRAAKRQRNLGFRGRGERGGYARHDLEGNIRRPKRGHLLAGAAEDERVAGLEAHDAAAVRGFADKDRVDVVLRRAVHAAPLADVDPLRVAAAHGDHRLRHERVVHDHVGFLQDALGAKREKVGGARTGADEPHEAVLL